MVWIASQTIDGTGFVEIEAINHLIQLLLHLSDLKQIFQNNINYRSLDQKRNKNIL